MKIILTENFRYGRGGFLTPGPYRVPQDIPEALAEQAVKAGVATRNVAPSVPFRKGPAPENKAIGPAPDSKAEVARTPRRRRSAGTVADE